MYIIKQGDQRPFAETIITRGGVAVDLSTASAVVFKMRKFGAVANTVDSACVITDAPNGVCEYRWQAGDTDEVGRYWAEFEVLWPDSTTETFPSLAQEVVHISDSLD